MKHLIVAAIAVLGFTISTGPVAAQTASDTIKQIDTDCLAIQNATMALQPINVALVSNQWKVLSAGDFTVAEQTHASATFAQVWQQGKNFAWIHAHSFDAAGNQRATQLCFRQSDGTLERARQAATVPDLNGASAQVAYFAGDGTLIQKTALFEVNDPALAKKISDLPYYSVLP